MPETAMAIAALFRNAKIAELKRKNEQLLCLRSTASVERLKEEVVPIERLYTRNGW